MDLQQANGELTSCRKEFQDKIEVSGYFKLCLPKNLSASTGGGGRSGRGAQRNSCTSRCRNHARSRRPRIVRSDTCKDEGQRSYRGSLKYRTAHAFNIVRRKSLFFVQLEPGFAYLTAKTSHQDRITAFTSEIKRLKARLVAEAGDKDLMQFIFGADHDASYIQSLKSKLEYVRLLP